MPSIGYQPDGHAGGEPTALAALAFVAHQRLEAAHAASDALAAMQQANGEVSVRTGEQSPGWPTSLAVSAWCAADRAKYANQIAKAIAWLLANRGRGVERSINFGHNT